MRKSRGKIHEMRAFCLCTVVHFHLQKSKLVGGHLIIIWRQNRFETISFPRPPPSSLSFLQFLFLLPRNRLKIKYRNLKKKKKKKKMRKRGGERGRVHIIIISIISDRRLMDQVNPHLYIKCTQAQCVILA